MSSHSSRGTDSISYVLGDVRVTNAMSEYQTPIGPLFELQRETLKRGADLLQVPRTIREHLFEEGLAPSEQAGRQLLELSRGSIQQSLRLAALTDDDALDDLSETVDELFDELQAEHDQLYDTVEETYEQTETEALTRGAEQLTVLLNLNRRLEDQLTTAAERLEAQATQSDEVATELTEQIERLSDQLDQYTELQQRLGGNVDPAKTPTETGNSDVRCQVCGTSYGAITYSHLQTHEMTVEEYREEFGADVPM